MHSRGPVETVIRDSMPSELRLLAVETQEAVTRLRNLMGYMETKTFHELPPLEQRLLDEQREHLSEYAKTLSLRYCMGLLDG